MINQLDKLTSAEKALVYKAPVLVSVLASCSDHEVNEAKKADAIKLAHLKTFTADPLLITYYNRVEKDFASQFEAIASKYYPFDEEKRAQLQEEINSVENVIAKLDDQFAEKLRKSLRGYANHVKRSTHSVFQDFIIPLRMEGLND